MRCWTPVVATLALLIAVADAKRGCSVYGHSCYGGMGKRDSGDVLPSQEEVAQGVIQQQEEDPAMVFMGPRNGFNMAPKQFYYIPPLFRQWLLAFRKAQEQQQNNDTI